MSALALLALLAAVPNGSAGIYVHAQASADCEPVPGSTTRAQGSAWASASASAGLTDVGWSLSVEATAGHDGGQDHQQDASSQVWGGPNRIDVTAHWADSYFPITFKMFGSSVASGASLLSPASARPAAAQDECASGGTGSTTPGIGVLCQAVKEAMVIHDPVALFWVGPSGEKYVEVDMIQGLRMYSALAVLDGKAVLTNNPGDYTFTTAPPPTGSVQVAVGSVSIGKDACSVTTLAVS